MLILMKMTTSHIWKINIYEYPLSVTKITQTFSPVHSMGGAFEKRGKQKRAHELRNGSSLSEALHM